MNKILLSICSLTLFLNCQNKAKEVSQEDNRPTYSDTICFRPATLEEAKKLMLTEDSYILNRSSFDIVSRLQNPEGTKEELIAMSIQELREWTDEEKEKIQHLTETINNTIRREPFKLPLPKEIMLVKSTLNDEGGAGGYTRSNWIALTDRLFTHLPTDFHQKLLLHETFHVLTRNSLAFKRKMYETIGFTVTDEELDYPKDLWDIHISNPDVGRYDSYATFIVEGKPVKCAMVLYADRPYTTGSFFQYMNIGFVPYNEQMKPEQENGKTIVYPMEKISDFKKKIGENTQYIIHPEEILAENFVLAFTDQQSVPTPDLKEKVRKILKSNL